MSLKVDTNRKSYTKITLSILRISILNLKGIPLNLKKNTLHSTITNNQQFIFFIIEKLRSVCLFKV
jgi:hypothetical protein